MESSIQVFANFSQRNQTFQSTLAGITSFDHLNNFGVVENKCEGCHSRSRLFQRGNAASSPSTMVDGWERPVNPRGPQVSVQGWARRIRRGQGGDKATKAEQGGRGFTLRQRQFSDVSKGASKHPRHLYQKRNTVFCHLSGGCSSSAGCTGKITELLRTCRFSIL